MNERTIHCCSDCNPESRPKDYCDCFGCTVDDEYMHLRESVMMGIAEVFGACDGATADKIIEIVRSNDVSTSS